MSKATIEKVTAREILDSRGNPTLECCVVLSDGAVGVAAVPSGASTGQFEAHEMRDGDPARYKGRGVLHAVNNVKCRIAPLLAGQNATRQEEIDRLLITTDGTPNKNKFGANAILGVSLATARAAANHYRMPLFRYIGGISALRLPTPLFNVLNGGAHAANNVDIQEFMLAPVGLPSFAEALRCGSEIYHTLGGILRGRGLATTVGDEGGFAPDLESDEQALELLCEAIERAGYTTKEVRVSLDAAASEWQQEDGTYLLPKRKKAYTYKELIAYWEDLAARYPLLSLEDGLGDADLTPWRDMTDTLGKKLLLVGDDLFVTSPKRLQKGIERGAANAILLKPNQIGTLSETLEAVRTAKTAGYRAILSHRSGETEDTSIADICVGTNTPFIKSGAPCRAERTAKYNRLLRIEETLCPAGEEAIFAFSGSFVSEL